MNGKSRKVNVAGICRKGNNRRAAVMTFITFQQYVHALAKDISIISHFYYYVRIMNIRFKLSIY
jgi:hypothetical protein